MWVIFESRTSDKQLKKYPKDILMQYEAWKKVIELSGPLALKRIPGYRDHALKGKWKGTRSSYLNKTWRVIYKVNKKEVFIQVLEVNPHEY